MRKGYFELFCICELEGSTMVCPITINLCLAPQYMTSLITHAHYKATISNALVHHPLKRTNFQHVNTNTRKIWSTMQQILAYSCALCNISSNPHYRFQMPFFSTSTYYFLIALRSSGFLKAYSPRSISTHDYVLASGLRLFLFHQLVFTIILLLYFHRTNSTSFTSCVTLFPHLPLFPSFLHVSSCAIQPSYSGRDPYEAVRQLMFLLLFVRNALTSPLRCQISLHRLHLK
ncbi:uncharacterized protein BDR25DRAFT_361509 [Lindgomyces ingoldianus]|uniref:Uncharacterized protein n=1 Tax=Lindgomyces ingoldianus TaxID=673940 RepID=A0ACB6QC17_9PLEO|nr:uncharacterized protein BDR25DRAFT_361509 [Lindgomyces ingoldianus]KAF2464441.1 hypothetical protein BDR25DRAFT_361509 [Lindgomyces ingoldianus]